ncbi:hypothetical protein [Dongia sp.]|uniref:hypothetical protein n=1 Tax=Dongia sp. TaxID=1977262 RepID=UPI0037526674
MAQKKSNGSKPSMIARVKQSPDSDYMVTIGAAWPFKEGEGMVVKLQSLPIQWDGDFILVPPKEDDS